MTDLLMGFDRAFTATRCRCGGNICRTNRDGSARKSRYKCRGCRRWVPWCFGAADDMPYHCDDCWNLLSREVC